MSELKFKLTDKTKINALGVELFQIEATADIEARGVKKGDKGGWVESELLANGEPRIAGDAWVSGNAQVYGNAQVSGDAWVSGNAQVYGNAWASGNARVSGDALVHGDAEVYGDALVHGDAEVYGDAHVSGNAWVYGNAVLSAKKMYRNGRFVGGDDSDDPTFTEITDKTGSSYWKHQYVIGDYRIDDLDEPENEPESLEMTVSDIEKLVGHKVKIINKGGK